MKKKRNREINEDMDEDDLSFIVDDIDDEIKNPYEAKKLLKMKQVIA